jgi:hypothetical protein
MTTFRYYDHPRNMIALLRAQLGGDISEVADTARQRGINIDSPECKYLRETLWQMTQFAAGLLSDLAAREGRTPWDVLDELQVQFEAQLPPGHNADEPPDAPPLAD